MRGNIKGERVRLFKTDGESVPENSRRIWSVSKELSIIKVVLKAKLDKTLCANHFNTMVLPAMKYTCEKFANHEILNRKLNSFLITSMGTLLDERGINTNVLHSIPLWNNGMIFRC